MKKIMFGVLALVLIAGMIAPVVMAVEEGQATNSGGNDESIALNYLNIKIDPQTQYGKAGEWAEYKVKITSLRENPCEDYYEQGLACSISEDAYKLVFEGDLEYKFFKGDLFISEDNSIAIAPKQTKTIYLQVKSN